MKKRLLGRCRLRVEGEMIDVYARSEKIGETTKIFFGKREKNFPLSRGIQSRQGKIISRRVFNGSGLSPIMSMDYRYCQTHNIVFEKGENCPKCSMLFR